MNHTAVPHRRAPRGFSLIELMIASSISLLVIAGAVTVGVQLQHRGILEERTTETQNAGRAARDLLAFDIQRAGAGAGSTPLTIGGTGGPQADQRYAVWVTTEAQFAGDSTFALPAGRYADLKSDAIEVWATDPSTMSELRFCVGTTTWLGTDVCTKTVPSADLVGHLAVVVSPKMRMACLGQVTARDAVGLKVTWTPGLPGSPSLPSSDPCADPLNGMGPGGGPDGGSGSNIWKDADTAFIMRVESRSFRVNWKSGSPVLEMDSDGFMGDAGYVGVSTEIERLQLRMGVGNLDQIDAGIAFFPEADPNPALARPGLDQCTNSTCWSRIPGDAGMAAGPNDTGLQSARDELMRRVQVVELGITARSQRFERDQVQPTGNDEDGNPLDGYKRRHFIVRLAPRNFSYAARR